MGTDRIGGQRPRSIQEVQMDCSYPPNGIEIESRQDGGDYIIRVRGELDLAQCEKFETELKNALQSDASAVLLDLRELNFIDSTGIRALLLAVGLSEANGSRLRVARETSRAVQRTFDMTGVGERLPFVD
jgi:anti-anti-sigma factor